MMLTLVGPQRPVDLVRRVSWVVGVGLVSWWIAGRLGVGRDPSPPHSRPPLRAAEPEGRTSDAHDRGPPWPKKPAGPPRSNVFADY
jgi:hypothetical protein